MDTGLLKEIHNRDQYYAEALRVLGSPGNGQYATQGGWLDETSFYVARRLSISRDQMKRRL